MNKQPLFLSSGEPYQPVRFRCNVRKQKVYHLLTDLHFAEYEKEHKGFLLRHEFLFPSETGVDKRFKNLWPPGSAARFFFTGDKHMTVIAPTYLRSIDTLTFLVKFLGKEACRVTGADIFMWNYEDTPENIRLLNRLDPFEGKQVIITDFSVYDAKLHRILQEHEQEPEKLLQEIESLMDEAYSQPQPEIEHWDIEHTQEGLSLFNKELELQLIVAFARFKGNKIFNKFDAMDVLLEKEQKGGRRAA
jgi:hypothetical protein